MTVLMDKLGTCCDGWDREVANMFVNVLVLTQGMVLILYGTEKVAIEQWPDEAGLFVGAILYWWAIFMVFVMFSNMSLNSISSSELGKPHKPRGNKIGSRNNLEQV